MQLSDLLHAPSSLFRPPPPSRTAERKLLIVPLHAAVDTPQMQAVLATAADAMARSGLVWKWVCTDGKPKLCRWDQAQKVFLRGTLEDWVYFIGEHWIVKDTNNVEYRGPSIVVTDRLVSAVLKNPDTPEASWALQLSMKRQAAERK